MNRLKEISDVDNGSIELQGIIDNIIVNILIAIDKNKEIQLSCFAVAIASLGDCGDAINLGLLRMQIIALKCNYANKKMPILHR